MINTATVAGLEAEKRERGGGGFTSAAKINYHLLIVRSVHEPTSAGSPSACRKNSQL